LSRYAHAKLEAVELVAKLVAEAAATAARQACSLFITHRT
jgi:hypothetical protein